MMADAMRKTLLLPRALFDRTAGSDEDKWSALLEAVREANRRVGADFDSAHVVGVGTRRVDGGNS